MPDEMGGMGSRTMMRSPEMMMDGGIDGEEGEMPEMWELRRYDFIVQFVWKPTPRKVRNGEAEADDGMDAMDDSF